jgi:hypothetical protein
MALVVRLPLGRYEGPLATTIHGAQLHDTPSECVATGLLRRRPQVPSDGFACFLFWLQQLVELAATE